MRRLSTVGKVFFGGLGIVVVVGAFGVSRLVHHSSQVSSLVTSADHGALITIQEAYPSMFNLTDKDSMSVIMNRLYKKGLITPLYRNEGNNSGWDILIHKYHVIQETSPNYTVKSVNIQKLNGIKRANVVISRVLTLTTVSKQSLSANQTMFFDLWNESGHWKINSSKVLGSTKPA